MRRKYLFILILSLVGTIHSNAQTLKPRQLLKKVDSSLANIKTIIYKMDRVEQSFGDNDTLRRSAVCSLHIQPKDKIGTHHIVDIKYPENKYEHRKYDGTYTSIFNYHADSLSTTGKVKIQNAAQTNYNSIVGAAVRSFILVDYFKKPTVFSQGRSILARFFIKKMEVVEDVYQDKPVYVLIIYGKNREGSTTHISNAIMKYYIRKSDFLPVAHSLYGEFDGLKINEYYSIEYLAINPELTLEDFKVDVNVTEMNPGPVYKRVSEYLPANP